MESELRILLRRIILKEQFIQILEEEAKEIEAARVAPEKTDPDRPAAT